MDKKLPTEFQLLQLWVLGLKFWFEATFISLFTGVCILLSFYYILLWKSAQEDNY